MDIDLEKIDRLILAAKAELSPIPAFKKFQRLEEIRAQYLEHIVKSKELLGEINGLAGGEDNVAAPPSKPTRNKKTRSKTKTKTSPTAVIVSVSCNVINEHNRPMPLAVLHELLVRQGISNRRE